MQRFGLKGHTIKQNKVTLNNNFIDQKFWHIRQQLQIFAFNSNTRIPRHSLLLSIIFSNRRQKGSPRKIVDQIFQNLRFAWNTRHYDVYLLGDEVSG